MANKIELEYPYSRDWNNGYLVKDVNGRIKVILYNSNRDRTSTLLSRYKMAVYLGRYLTEVEHVDHLDEDKYNDDITNLQIVSVKENNVKHSISKGGKKLVDFNCVYCGNRFTRRYNQSMFVKVKTHEFCSRTCMGKSKNGKVVNYEMNPVVYMEYG